MLSFLPLLVVHLIVAPNIDNVKFCSNSRASSQKKKVKPEAVQSVVERILKRRISPNEGDPEYLVKYQGKAMRVDCNPVLSVICHHRQHGNCSSVCSAM